MFGPRPDTLYSATPLVIDAVLATKTLLIAGEGGVHTNEAGERVALLRAYDKAAGADVGAVPMRRITPDLP